MVRAGSRWLGGGVQLHTVRDWLGHSSIEQTSTYLKNTVRSKHDAMEAFERQIGRVQPGATEAGTRGQNPTPTTTTPSTDTEENTPRHNPATIN